MTISALHEPLVEMFVDHPRVVAKLLGRRGATARLQTSALSTTDIAEQRADAVVGLGEPLDEIVIVEVQTSLDRSKPAAWASYATVARRRWRVPVRVLVLTVDPALAEYYARPFVIGPKNQFHFWIVGPRQLADHARRQETRDVSTMMAAIANPGDTALGLRAFEFATTFDSPAATGYTELIQAASPAVRAFMEEQMRIDPTKLKSTYSKLIWARYTEGLEAGRQEVLSTLRAAVRAVATARGLTLSDAHVQRLETATLDELEAWHARALVVDVDEPDAIFA